MLRPAFTELRRDTTSGSSSAVPPACSDESGRTSSKHVSACSRCSRSAPRCSKCSARPSAHERPFVRVGDELENPALSRSRSSARPTGSRRRRSAPSACSVRSAWTTRRRSGPCVPPHTSSRASWSPSTRTTEPWSKWRRRIATTTRSSASLARPRSGHQARFQAARARAAPRRLRRARRGRAFREVVEAYEVLSKTETRELYDRFGHAGLRSGGFQPTPFDFGSLADIFSAFFGDDVFGVATRRAQGSRSGHRRRDRDLARGSRDGCQAGRPRAGCDPVREVRRRRRPAGNDCVYLRRLRRHGSHPARLANGLRRVHPHAGVRALRRHRPDSRASVRACSGAGRVLEERASKSRCRPASTTGNGSAFRAKGMRDRSAASRRPVRAGSHPASTNASSAMATTSSRPST